MPSARLGARGLGGKKTELTANRSHAARFEYARSLRRALDDKLAKLWRDVKKLLYFRTPSSQLLVGLKLDQIIVTPYLSLSPFSVLGLAVFAATTFRALFGTAAWRMSFCLDFCLAPCGDAGVASSP